MKAAATGRVKEWGLTRARLTGRMPRAASRVAGAFEVQLVDRVPAAPHDIGVDCIVTEQRIIDCARMPA